MVSSRSVAIAFQCVMLFLCFERSRSRRIFTDPKELPKFSSWKSWKTWGDFNNSANWGGGHIPCSGDRVVFPRTLKVIAYLGSEPTGTWSSEEHVQIRELQFPYHGVLMLPWDGQIDFLGESGRTEACPGTDVLFTSRENVWLNPSNWDDPSVSAAEAEAVPHLRRIPCGQDVAFFQYPFFRILLPDFSVRTGALYIYSTPTFYRGTWPFVKMYFGDSLISSWPESEGSPLHLAESQESLLGVDQCGMGVEGTEEETQQLMDGVCRNVVCPPLDCTRPVRPHLHCCHICGAVVELSWPSHATSPDIHAVKQAVLQTVEDIGIDATSTKSPVAVHASMVPIQHGLLQVVVLQRILNGEHAQSVATAIADRLHGWSGYGVARLRASGGPIQGATITSVLSTLFLPLLAAVAAISAIIFYLGEVRSFREFGRQLDAVVFARFENLTGTEDGEDRIHVQIDKPPSPPTPPLKVRSARGSWTASPRQFQNPLFQESPPRSDDTALTDFSATDVENKSVTHENPLYAELLKREKQLESTLGADTNSRNESSSSSDSVDSSPLVDIDL